MFKNIEAALSDSNISKVAFARIIGISEKSVQNKLNGTTEWTLSEIYAVRQLFPQYTFEYLFGRKSNNPPA